MAVNHREKNVIFMAKKFVALISIKILSSRRQKSFEGKTKNFAKIIANIMHF